MAAWRAWLDDNQPCPTGAATAEDPLWQRIRDQLATDGSESLDA
jgi:hypothetical protein